MGGRERKGGREREGGKGESKRERDRIDATEFICTGVYMYMYMYVPSKIDQRSHIPNIEGYTCTCTCTHGASDIPL